MRRWRGIPVLLVLAVAALLAATRLPSLRFEHNTRSLLREDRVADAREAELAATFGSEDLLLVAWEVSSVLDAGEFEKLRRIADEIGKIEGIEGLWHLAHPDVRLRLGHELRAIREDDLATEQGRETVRRALLGATPYLGTIYNRELNVVAIAGTILPAPPAKRFATVRAIREIARREEGSGQIHVAGVTALALDAGEYAVEDLERIGLYALLVSVTVLFLLCRSVRETLIAVAATTLPPLYALAAAVLLDTPITALSAALFPVMAVVGITSSVHLLNAYGEERRDGADAAAAAGRAVRRLALPIILSLATTCAAFLSLSATGVPAFRSGGQVVALGMLLAIPVVLLGIPAALALLAPEPRLGAARLDRPLVRLGRWTARHTRWILAGSLVLVAVGGRMATGARVSVEVLQAFQPDSRIAQTYAFLEHRLTATIPADAVLRARSGAAMDEVLGDLDRFEKTASRIDGVENVMSLATLIEYGKRASPLPVDNAGALLYLRLAEPAITRRFLDVDGRRYRVKLRLADGTPPEVLDRLERAAGEMRTGPATLTGLYVRAVGTTRRLILDLARGVLLMSFLIVAVVALALRSWRLGLAALLPNLLPPAVVFGAAAVAGVAFDVSVVAVGAVAVGLAVDDTLHVLFRVVDEQRRGRSLDEALLEAQRHVGRALVLSTVVLVAGLSCLAFSAFLPTARFGLFTALACAVALPADLIVLPACLRVRRSPSRA